MGEAVIRTKGRARTAYARVSLMAVILAAASGSICGAGALWSQSTRLHRSASVEPSGDEARATIWALVTRADAAAYIRVARDGYSFARNTASDVAFFPGHPLAIRAVNAWLGTTFEASALLASNICFAIAMVVLPIYAKARKTLPADRAVPWTVAAMAFYPAGFFARFGYSESLFILLALCVLACLAIDDTRARWVAVAASACATAVRPTGIAVAAATVVAHFRPGPLSVRGAARIVGIALLSCGGLWAYMLFLWRAFGDPLVFMNTQYFFRVRPDEGVVHKMLALLSFEPVWAPYVHGMPRFLDYVEDAPHALFSLKYANAPCFLLAVCCVVLGACKRWLSAPELVYGALVLAIPYATRAYEMCMVSQARFAFACIPAFLVAGRCLGSFPVPWGIVIMAGSSIWMFAYSALFAAGYNLW